MKAPLNQQPPDTYWLGSNNMVKWQDEHLIDS